MLESDFNQEEALLGAFFVILNLQVDIRFKLYHKGTGFGAGNNTLFGQEYPDLARDYRHPLTCCRQYEELLKGGGGQK